MANAEKKRKAEGKTTAATSKKQKIATALAEPTCRITIKNISMRQWNEWQPGGQGLATDFDAYFKGLSDAEKEVPSFTQTHDHTDIGLLPHTQPFKRTCALPKLLRGCYQEASSQLIVGASPGIWGTQLRIHPCSAVLMPVSSCGRCQILQLLGPNLLAFIHLPWVIILLLAHSLYSCLLRWSVDAL